MEDKQFLIAILRHVCNGHTAQARAMIAQLDNLWYPKPSPEERAAAIEAKKAPAPAPAKASDFATKPKPAPAASSKPTGV